MFSPLKPEKLKSNKGKHNKIKITTLTLIEENKMFTIKNTRPYQIRLTKAVV